MLSLDLNELRRVAASEPRQSLQGLLLLDRLGLLPPGVTAPYRRVPGDVCWRCGGPVLCGVASMHRCPDQLPRRAEARVLVRPHFSTPRPSVLHHARRQRGGHP